MSSSKPGCLASVFRLFGLGKKENFHPKSQGVKEFEPDILEALPYRLRDDFISPAEASFLHVLKNMVGDKMLICPKVSFAELFFVAQSNNRQTYRNKIDRKRVDFVLCNPKTFKPVFAIELDDSSHARPDRIERDEFVNAVFETAGLPLVRVKAQASYNTSDLAKQFQNALSQKKAKPESAGASDSPKTDVPICPKYNIPMVTRTARKGNRAGQQFWGCPNYPQCRVVFRVESV